MTAEGVGYRVARYVLLPITAKVPAAIVVGGPCIAGPETITAKGHLIATQCEARKTKNALLAMTV